LSIYGSKSRISRKHFVTKFAVCDCARRDVNDSAHCHAGARDVTHDCLYISAISDDNVSDLFCGWNGAITQGNNDHSVYNNNTPPCWRYRLQQRNVVKLRILANCCVSNYLPLEIHGLHNTMVHEREISTFNTVFLYTQ